MVDRMGDVLDALPAGAVPLVTADHGGRRGMVLPPPLRCSRPRSINRRAASAGYTQARAVDLKVATAAHSDVAWVVNEQILERVVTPRWRARWRPPGDVALVARSDPSTTRRFGAAQLAPARLADLGRDARTAIADAVDWRQDGRCR
jgi:hypothetical protein